MNRASILAYAILAHAVSANAQDQLWAYPSTVNPPGGRARCVIQYNKQDMVIAMLERGVEAPLLRQEGIPSPDWKSTAVVLAHMPPGVLGIPDGRFLERRDDNVVLNFDNSNDSTAAVVAVPIALASVRPGRSNCNVSTTGASSASVFRYLRQQKGDKPSKPVRGRIEPFTAGAEVAPPASNRCDIYATTAVEAHELNVSKRCRLEASNPNRWNSQYQFHYQWCLGLDSNSVEPQKETKLRAWQLQNLCAN